MTTISEELCTATKEFVIGHHTGMTVGCSLLKHNNDIDHVARITLRNANGDKEGTVSFQWATTSSSKTPADSDSTPKS